MPRKELEATNYLSGLERISFLKIIQLFKYDSRRYPGIAQIKMKSNQDNIKTLVGFAGLQKIQILARDKDGSSIIYAEGKTQKEWIRLTSNLEDMHILHLSLTPEGWRITFIGNDVQVKKFLNAVSKFGLHSTIASASNAMFANSSFLSVLTDRQRKVITSAYSLGFFETPRRIDTRGLAKSLNLGKSVTIEHLRKVEKRLLREILASEIA